MRCLSCNAALSDYEATRKSAVTEEYTDLCNHCFATVSDDLLTIDREDLLTDEDDLTPEDVGEFSMYVDRDEL